MNATPDFESRLAVALAHAVPRFESLRSVTRLSGGASQETYRLEVECADGDRRLALRRAAGGIEATEGFGPGLATEALLFAVAQRAGVPEPEILHVLTEADGLGPGFLMEWLEGETVGSRILRSDALATIRPALARQCGEVLARIHGIDIEAEGLAEKLETVSPRDFVEEVWASYRSFETALPMIDYTARWLLDHLPESSEVRLVHNDFRNGNIMVSPEGIVAVLDWELAHLGDPVRDLGWICTNSWRFGRQELPVGGFGHVEDLLDGYESVSGRRIDLDHLRFWEVFGSFWWAVMSLKMAIAWRERIDRSVERPAVARRSSECQLDCVNLIIPGDAIECEAESPASSLDTPRTDELLVSVREFLRDEARPALEGRNAFLALVAANSIDIALRELTLGPAHGRSERKRLMQLLQPKDTNASIDALRTELCARLRSGDMPLDTPGLAAHLRTTVVNQVRIDQPSYSGLTHHRQEST